MKFSLLSLVFNLLLIRQSLGICPKNEQFYMCGACDGSCRRPIWFCIDLCRLPGNCGCIAGFVRDLNSYACVDKDSPECVAQRVCGENEEYFSCGACDGTCANPYVGCTKECREGTCGCVAGYVRDNKKICVDKNSPDCVAQRECGENEQNYGCGACDGTCVEPDLFCTLDCRPGSCGCVPGFVRNNQYICVDRNSTNCVAERRLNG